MAFPTQEPASDLSPEEELQQLRKEQQTLEELECVLALQQEEERLALMLAAATLEKWEPEVPETKPKPIYCLSAARSACNICAILHSWLMHVCHTASYTHTCCS